MYSDNWLEDRYEVCELIGRGGFGEVYTGYDHENESEVAIKIEDLLDHDVSYLEKENEVYSKLKHEGSIGIPNIQLFGGDSQIYYMMMDLLGPDLEKLLSMCSGKFSLKTVLLLADQMISIIQYIHSKDYIHGDVKPGNFLLGQGDSNHMLYMVDFGLAQKYRDPHTRKHIHYSEKASYGGTTRFTSLNSHQHIQLSRRDDMESLGYVLIYFLRGNLPWQGITVSEGSDNKKEKRRLVYEKKVSTSIEELCTCQPSEFVTYMKYCCSLQFDEEPDYIYMSKLFKDLFHRSGFTEDNEFDWTISKLGKRCNNPCKFVEDNIIFATDVMPWELNHFLKITYTKSEAETNIYEHSVEGLVEESFKFIFPEGIPSYSSKYKSNIDWKSTVEEMCSEFFESKEVYVWMKENYYLDYTDTNISDMKKQFEIILGKNRIGKTNHVDNVFFIRMHRVLAKLVEEQEDTMTMKDKCERHESIKGLMYSMMEFLGIPLLYNDEGKQEIPYKKVADRTGGVTIIGKPDVTMHLPIEGEWYPYCVMEVNGPDRRHVPYKSRTSEDSSSQVYKSISSESGIVHQLPSNKKDGGAILKKRENVSLKDQMKETTTSNQLYLSSEYHRSVTRQLKAQVPITCNSESAFAKLAAQLVIYMDGIVLKKEKIQMKLKVKLSKRKYCDGFGLFVMNEHIFMGKVIHDSDDIDFFHAGQTEGVGYTKQGARVAFTDWGFNLKRPNDRMAFLIFLSYLYQILWNEASQNI